MSARNCSKSRIHCHCHGLCPYQADTSRYQLFPTSILPFSHWAGAGSINLQSSQVCIIDLTIAFMVEGHILCQDVHIVNVWFGFIQVLTEPSGQCTSGVRNRTCALSTPIISLALKLVHLPSSASTQRKSHQLGGHIHESVAVGLSTSFEPASCLQL